jgi:hypothetical protein
MNEDIKNTSDVNDESRNSPALSITSYAQVVRKPMPSMTDNELYLRVNVPDGLQNDGSWAKKYTTDDPNAHRNHSVTPLRTEAGE